MLRPEHFDALSANGRINALYFLTRTAPLAWDSVQENAGRDALAFLEARNKTNALGNQTWAEVKRLAALLDAVKAGSPIPPA